MSIPWQATDRVLLPKRAILLLTATTYRAPAFLSAANQLGIEIIKAINMDNQLAEYWNYPLGIDFTNPDNAVQSIVEYAVDHPIGAIMAVDDSGSLIASRASEALNLPHNKYQAALAARNKFLMLECLAGAGVPHPHYKLHNFNHPLDSAQLQNLAFNLVFPCVLKPLELNGSRGVIRANNEEEFSSAAVRLYRILRDIYGVNDPIPFLVEEYIDGPEVALEGIIDDGEMQVLAIFDKPDPLIGPFFEETIYVTPSRLPGYLQQSISEVTSRAAAAIELTQGSIHAELRIANDQPIIIEVAGRSIGGLCSQTLRFGTDVSLEQLILRQAFGLPYNHLHMPKGASGVMMIPIPEAGILKSISGCEDACAVPLIEEVQITAKLNYPLVPLPEGDNYLGFIFSRGDSPSVVEEALRAAHDKITFEIAPQLPMASF